MNSTTTEPTKGPLPGLRGIDHIGLTVPDLDQAAAFFTDVLGCTTVTRVGPFRDDSGSFMADVLDVHPRAVIERIVLQRCGHGSNIELFKYTAPDQTTLHPRNSDIGAHHLAFYVDDIDAATDNALGAAEPAPPGATRFLIPQGHGLRDRGRRGPLVALQPGRLTRQQGDGHGRTVFRGRGRKTPPRRR